MGEVELAIIRRVLFAASGAGNVSVTREEAEWLFDLDTATKGYAHVAGWRDLFVLAVMNHLFAVSPAAALERGEIVRRAEWLNTTAQGGIGAYLARTFEGGLQRLPRQNQTNERIRCRIRAMSRSAAPRRMPPTLSKRTKPHGS